MVRWLRAANAAPSARDRALVLTPFYAGARIAEVVRLDVDDVRLSARKGTIRFEPAEPALPHPLPRSSLQGAAAAGAP